METGEECVGADELLRLVEHKIMPLSLIDGLPVHADFLPWQDAESQFCNGFAVDVNSAGGNQLFAGASASQPGGGKNLLKAYARAVVRRCVR